MALKSTQALVLLLGNVVLTKLVVMRSDRKKVLRASKPKKYIIYSSMMEKINWNKLFSNVAQ